MSWARRPEEETPRMASREFRDERGRTWVGSVRSGTQPGGEESAEVIFVCRDEPGELKRVVQLGVSAGEADQHWEGLSEEDMRDLLDGSDPG